MLSSHLILCCPLLLLPPTPPSIRVFSNESALHTRWAKYWSFSFSISPSNEHPGLISFRMDWLDLLAVQGTLKSLLQHHSLKQIASLGWIHKSRAQGWCTGKTQSDGMGREVGRGVQDGDVLRKEFRYKSSDQDKKELGKLSTDFYLTIGSLPSFS